MASAKQDHFSARLLRPEKPGDGGLWAFVVLPKAVSAALPRRGRTSVEGTLNGTGFRALLEPDGQKSHWLRIDPALLDAANATVGDVAEFEIRPLAREPEPEVPADLRAALQASPPALATWQATTTLARVDWIHWVVSAKQAKTRAKRIRDACDKLASGEKRVCCFDPSGFYSKALSAPRAAE
ncbi:YdeI/OmpD-associated family protein [Alloalcanivorax mobilis]|uniref:YdeI/OmpD-associated family protein n=1 Tax=Alloalcanivorax mobilis TaxID=2019569 RepID=UPI000C77AE35|nr:YdeI/OmpD-associated family protein [Alloalcanivorax mobilis]